MNIQQQSVPVTSSKIINKCISCNSKYLCIQISENSIEIFQQGVQQPWEKINYLISQKDNSKGFQNPVQFPFNITSLQAHSLYDNLIFIGGVSGNACLYNIETNVKTAIDTLANQDINLIKHYSRLIQGQWQKILVICDSIGKIRIYDEGEQDDTITFQIQYSESMNAEIKDITQRNIQRDDKQFIDILILTDYKVFYQITAAKAITSLQWNQDNQQQQTIDTIHYYKHSDYLAMQHQDELVVANFNTDKLNVLHRQKLEFSEKSGVNYLTIENVPYVVYFTPDCHTVKIMNLKTQTVQTQEIDDELFGIQILNNEIIACTYKKLIWIYLKDQEIQQSDDAQQQEEKFNQNEFYQEINQEYEIIGGQLCQLQFQVEVLNYELTTISNSVGLIYSNNFIKTAQFYESKGQMKSSDSIFMLNQIQNNKSLKDQFFLDNELTPCILNDIMVVQTGESEIQVSYNVFRFDTQTVKPVIHFIEVPHKISQISIQPKSKTFTILAYHKNIFSIYEVSANNNPQLSSTFEISEDEMKFDAAQLQGNYIIASTEKEIIKITPNGKIANKCNFENGSTQGIHFKQIQISNQYIILFDATYFKIYYIDNREFEKIIEIGDCNQLINKASIETFKDLSSCAHYSNIQLYDVKSVYTLDNTICCAITFIGTNNITEKIEQLPYILTLELEQNEILNIKNSRLFHFNNVNLSNGINVQMDIFSNMVVSIQQQVFVLQGLFNPFIITNVTNLLRNKNESIVGLQAAMIVSYYINNQTQSISIYNVFNTQDATLQKQLIYSTFTKHVTNKQTTQALQLLSNSDVSVYDTIASLCIKMNQTQLLSNCVSKLQNLQLNQLIRADPLTNVSEIISNNNQKYIAQSSALSLKNSGIRRKQIVKLIGERCYMLGDIEGYNQCQKELNYKANQETETVDELIEKFQEMLQNESEQKLVEYVSQLDTKKAYYAAAKCLEENKSFVQATRFYELSKSDSSAVRAAIKSQDNGLLYQIASKSTNKQAVRQAARYFIQLGDSDSINKSLLLFSSAGYHIQAIELCRQQNLYQNLCDVVRQAIDAKAGLSKAYLTDIASFLISADVSSLPLDIQRYIQQTSIYIYSYTGDIATALASISRFDVKITEQIANELQPTDLNSEENRKITSTIAALCYKSGLYQLACKKYLSINDLQHSLQSLCKLNDAEKVIKFAIRSKNRGCLISAANWLANQNSQKYASYITTFYQKAKAWEELSGWYLQRAYDMCRGEDNSEKQYQKALKQLEVCQNQLNGVNIGNERSEQFAQIQKKITLNKKLLSGFLQIQEYARNNITTEASEIVELNTKKLIKIINDSDVDVMVDVTDVLNWMVEFYKSRGEVQKAKDLQNKIQGLNQVQQQPIQNDVQIDLNNQVEQQPQQQIQQQPAQQQQVIEGFPTSQSMIQQANQATLALNDQEELNIEL